VRTTVIGEQLPFKLLEGTHEVSRKDREGAKSGAVSNQVKQGSV
jgi:hypothetical protein